MFFLCFLNIKTATYNLTTNILKIHLCYLFTQLTNICANPEEKYKLGQLY